MAGYKDITELLGLQELIVVSYEATSEEVTLTCDFRFDWGICPQCGLPSQHIHQHHPKRIRDVGLWGKRCYLKFAHRRFICDGCGSTFMESVSFVDPRGHYTHRYEHSIWQMCRESTVRAVSQMEQLGYDAVEEIYYRQIQQRLAQVKGEPLTRLGLDEIAIKKGHQHFVLILSNLTTGRVIEVLEDRHKERLAAWLEALPAPVKAAIERVTMDMWSPYREAVEAKLPHAKIVADRFHVQKAVNACLTRARRTLQREAEEGNQAQVKGCRWVLVKNREDLQKDEADKLETVLKASPLIAEAYHLKEAFRAIFNTDASPAQARLQLEAWIEQVVQSGLKAFAPFLTTWGNWKEQILNYFEERLSNGFAEGINNKIKMVKRRCFGLTYHPHLRWRILDTCGLTKAVASS